MAPRTFRTREEALGLPRPRWNDPRSIYLADLKQAVLVLRKYARGFTSSDGYDLRYIEQWSGNQKRLVTRYINELQKLAVRPHEIVKPKAKEPKTQKKRLKQLQKVSGHSKGYPRFEVAVVPKSAEGLKVRFLKSGDIELNYPEGSHFIIEFDKKALARGDFLVLAEDVIQKLDKKKRVAVINIQAGMYTLRRGGRAIRYDPNAKSSRAPTIRALAAWLDKLADEYPQSDQSHAYTQWLRGVSVHMVGPDVDPAELQKWRYRQAQERTKKLEEERLKRRRRKDELEQFRVGKRMLSHFSSEEISDAIMRLTARIERRGKGTVREMATLQLYKDVLAERAKRGLL